MKVEQLCRFRTDDAGYRVFAKSEGITPQVEANHAKFFTSAMDPLFKAAGRLMPGRSVLTYNGTDDDFFISTSTMRTDISSRPSIFHHSFRISRSEYTEIMKTDPGAVLGIDVSSMFTSQHEVDSSADSSFELSKLNSLHFDEIKLREKYELNDERYAKLLIGAFRAITTGRSIKLVTDRECNAHELVREFAYCIAVGMPPAIRGRITLSSAMDTKTSICLSYPNGGESIGTAAFEYNIDNGTTSSNVSAVSDALAVFKAIAQMNSEERDTYFNRIEKAVDLVVPVELMNYELFLAAHFLCNESVEGREQNILSWLSAANSRLSNSIKLDGYYRINVYLIEHLNDKSTGVDMFAAEIFDHYIAGKKDGVEYEHENDFETVLVKNIQFNTAEASKQLLAKLLDTDLLTECAVMIHALIERIGEDDEFYNGEQLLGLTARIQQENATDLIDDCLRIIERFSMDNTVRLTEIILRDASLRHLNECEVNSLNILVSKLIENNVVLSGDNCSLLDEHYNDYDEALKDTCIAYLMNVRLNDKGSVERQFSSLIHMKESNPGYFMLLEKTITEDIKYRSSGVWERYQSVACFIPGKLYQYDEILDILNKNNVFKSHEGEFEITVKRVWKERYIRDLSDASSFEEAYRNGVTRSMKALKKANVSEETFSELETLIADEFWNKSSYKSIVLESNTELAEGLFNHTGSQRAKAKANLYKLCRQLDKNPRDSEMLCKFIINEHETFSPEGFKELKGNLYKLAVRIFKNQKKFISWDLLLLSRMSFKDAGYTIDYDGLIDAITNSADADLFERAVTAYTDDSYLLQSNSSVGKALRKAASRGKAPICKMLEKELKTEEGILKKLFAKDGKRNV